MRIDFLDFSFLQAHDVEAATALHELEMAEHEAAEVSSSSRGLKPGRESVDESVAKFEDDESNKESQGDAAAAIKAEEEASANMDDALRELLQVAEAATAALAGLDINAQTAGTPPRPAGDAEVEISSTKGGFKKVDEDLDDEDYDEDDYDEDEEESDDDGDEGDAWDPSQATPLVERAKARQRKNKPRTSPGSSAPPSMAELAALDHLNAVKAARGEPPAVKLTVPELRAALKGTTTAAGELWKGKGKKRGELLQDYMVLMARDAATVGGADDSSSVVETPKSGIVPDTDASFAEGGETAFKSTSVASPPRSEASDSGIGGGSGPQRANSGGSGSRRSPLSTMKGLLRRGSSSFTNKSQNSGDQGATGSPISTDRQSGKSSGKGSTLRMLTSFGSGRAGSFTSAKMPTPEPEASRSAASESNLGGSSMNGNGNGVGSREASMEVDAPNADGSLAPVHEGVPTAKEGANATVEAAEVAATTSPVAAESS